MPTDGGEDKFRALPIGVGRVVWPHAAATDAAGDEPAPSLPIARDAWADRTVVRHAVVVRQVDGTLTSRIAPTTEKEPACILDLVVLHDGASLLAREGSRVPGIACHFRIVIGDSQTLDSYAIWCRLPRADIAVSAATRDLDALADCFIDVMATDGLIGIDARDVLDVAGCRGSRVARGRAIVVPGQGVATGRLVRDALAEMAHEAALGGVLLYQSVSPADTTPQVLVEIDAMATTAVEGLDALVMLAGMYDRPRTEVVVIAFDR